MVVLASKLAVSMGPDTCRRPGSSQPGTQELAGALNKCDSTVIMAFMPYKYDSLRVIWSRIHFPSQEVS